jgi:hypothetical protein
MEIFERYLGPDWLARQRDAEFWKRIDDIPDHLFWSVRQTLKSRMLHLVNHVTRVQHLRNTGSEAHLDRLLALRPFTGPAAVVGSDVKIHYKGMLKGGKQFDSSYTSGRPFDVKLGAQQVIPGFEQGILGMRKGEKRTVTIPPSLGYGERGAGGVIPPNATLIFELEAVEIK